LIERYLFAFALTVAVELLVAVPVLGRSADVLSRRVGAVCVAQLATHPAVWFFWTQFAWPRPVYLLVAENFALITELAIYRLVFPRVPYARLLAASALANGASVVAGAWLQ